MQHHSSVSAHARDDAFAPAPAHALAAETQLASGAKTREDYRLDIQGLRAIAVLSVVLFHADHRLLPGGFVGVDIFFVISGYLITRILAKELGEARYSITRFYQRRMRRLFPALFVMLAFCFVAGALLLSPQDYRELAETAGTAIFFVSNFEFLRLSDYFGGNAEMKPLLHTWSLAVEEQFYIVFPLVLAGLWAWMRKRVRLVLFVCGAASLVLSMWAVRAWPDGAFYLAPFRAFELLIGSLLALSVVNASPRWRDVVSGFGLALIVASLLFISRDTPFPGVAALAPGLGAAAMIWAGQGGQSLCGRAISTPFFVFFGALSYSLYLWHWPLLAFGRHFAQGEMAPLMIAALVGAAVLLAWASYRFVEQPFLDKRAAKLPVLRLGGAGMALATMIAGAIWISDGAPQRFSPAANAMFAGAHDFNPRREECHSGEDAPIPYGRNCIYGAAGAAPSVALWGDSHGGEVVATLGERLAPEGGAVMQITAPSCPPALGYDSPSRPYCRAHNEETLTHLVVDARIHTVVLTANFAGYSLERDRLLAGYAESVERLRAAGKEVVMLTPMPVFAFDAPTALGMLAAQGRDPQRFGFTRAHYEAENAWATQALDALAARTGAVLVNSAEAICTREFCGAYRADAGVLYYNRNHVSETGARLITDAIPERVLGS